MKARIEHQGKVFNVNLAKPLHISFAVHAGENQLRAWWVNPVSIEAVQGESGPYLVSAGAPVNFQNITFNPHGHGTHTESVGHITEEIHSVNDVLRKSFFLAQLVSIEPKKMANDFVVTRAQLASAIGSETPEALVLRTLPNKASKTRTDYSGNNPPYLETEALSYLRQLGVKHLLLDLPSVDREEDEGALAGHKAFWNQPGEPDLERTITELIFVPNEISDGSYLLELQIAPFHNDASPSRPILYAIEG